MLRTTQSPGGDCYPGADQVIQLISKSFYLHTLQLLMCRSIVLGSLFYVVRITHVALFTDFGLEPQRPRPGFASVDVLCAARRSISSGSGRGVLFCLWQEGPGRRSGALE